MKKRVLQLSIITLFLYTVNACSSDNDCSRCKEITKKNGQIIKQSDPVEYCGNELTEKETATPVTIGDETTSYSCE